MPVAGTWTTATQTLAIQFSGGIAAGPVPESSFAADVDAPEGLFRSNAQVHPGGATVSLQCELLGPGLASNTASYGVPPGNLVDDQGREIQPFSFFPITVV